MGVFLGKLGINELEGKGEERARASIIQEAFKRTFWIWRSAGWNFRPWHHFCFYRNFFFFFFFWLCFSNYMTGGTKHLLLVIPAYTSAPKLWAFWRELRPPSAGLPTHLLAVCVKSQLRCHFGAIREQQQLTHTGVLQTRICPPVFFKRTEKLYSPSGSWQW